MSGGSLVVSIHDVSPATADAARRLRGLVTDCAGEVPVSLLVVPRYHGRAMWDQDTPAWIRERVGDGDEVVLHGLVHADGRGRDGAEFTPDTGLRGSMWAIAEGRSALAMVGLIPAGFVAPAYAHPRCLEAALADSGIAWWATRRELRARGRVIPLPSVGLGTSTRTKRAVSPLAAHAAIRVLREAPAVRLDLHPADLAHRRLAREVPRLMERLLGQGRRPVRHRDLLSC